MSTLDLAGKRVLIRQDLNVPVANGRITSDARLRASLPTLKLALEKGASVLVITGGRLALRASRAHGAADQQLDRWH
jgi:3-phosphoglycerate kinase